MPFLSPLKVAENDIEKRKEEKKKMLAKTIIKRQYNFVNEKRIETTDCMTFVMFHKFCLCSCMTCILLNINTLLTVMNFVVVKS